MSTFEPAPCAITSGSPGGFAAKAPCVVLFNSSEDVLVRVGSTVVNVQFGLPLLPRQTLTIPIDEDQDVIFDHDDPIQVVTVYALTFAE
jgi:hypothetical protein